MNCRTTLLARCCLSYALMLLCPALAGAEQPRTAERPVTSPSVSSQHPLASVLQFAREEQAYMRQSIRDFTCRLVKRERIEGILQDNQFIDLKLREEVRDGGRVIKPMAIYLQFVGPARLAGRRALFVAGSNDGKVLVRNGGRHFNYVVVEIDPDGQSARDESLVPITQSGFSQVLAQMINVLERHVQADPSGANTQVKRIAGAKINKRPASVIRITHPEKQKGLEFHVANVFIDDELRVPVRVDLALWPAKSGGQSPVLAEYTYTDLKLNVGLSDRDFDPSLVRGNRE